MTRYEQNQPDHSHLYDVPIEVLGLSETAIGYLKETGAMSVGDCIDYFLSIPNVMGEFRFGFRQIMHTEVKRKLVEHGYLAVDDTET
jgi:hypothetical protein